MSVDLLEHKLNYIKEKISPYVQNELEAYFQEIFCRCLQQHSLPRFLERYLFLDLCYIFVKHYMWLDHRLLTQAVVTYLSEEYRITKELGGLLSESLLKKAKDFFPSPKSAFFHSEDKNFLLYIFVHALTAQNNKRLIAELGLGTHLLQRLQQAAQYLAESGRDAAKVYFEADHDSEMIAVITNLSEKKAKTPWIADHYRLLFLTADIPSPWGGWFEKGGIAALFDFLLYLGESGSLPFPEAFAWFENQAKASDKSFFGEESCTFLFDELRKRNLLDASAYPFHNRTAPRPSPQNSSPSYLQLCSLGCDLTAEAFAYKHKDLPIQAQKLSSLSASWQSAYFAKIDAKQNHHIKELLGQKIRLHPPAIEEAARKLACNSDIKEVFFDLVQISKSGVPAIRAAACRSLSQLKAIREVSEVLGNIAINDGAEHVRDTALEELRKSLPHSAFTIYRKTPLATGKIA